MKEPILCIQCNKEFEGEEWMDLCLDCYNVKNDEDIS